MKTVAAIIPNKNSESTLAQTLESVRFCNEVILVDDGSTDKSIEIAAAYANVRVFHRRSYIYDNFNFGIDQTQCDWILRLDSDEVLSAALQRSVQDVLRSSEPPYPLYKARMHLYMLGRRIAHGFGNQTRTTLFRRGVARYPARSEHEDVDYSGPWGVLDGHYDHFTNPTISRWIDKINYYTDRDVERLAQPVRLSRTRVLYRAARFFQRLYFGPGWLFRDGYPGFVVACGCAVSMLLGDLKSWEKSESLPIGHLPGATDARQGAVKSGDSLPTTSEALSCDNNDRNDARPVHRT